jgi:hypothetical protein
MFQHSAWHPEPQMVGESGTSLTASLTPGVYAVRVTAITACGAGAASNQTTFPLTELATALRDK